MGPPFTTLTPGSNTLVVGQGPDKSSSLLPRTTVEGKRIKENERHIGCQKVFESQNLSKRIDISMSTQPDLRMCEVQGGPEEVGVGEGRVDTLRGRASYVESVWD